MRHILVIGATGNVGREVVSQLGPWPGVRIRALVRSPQPSCLPSEVEVMCGDLTSAETLDNCLDEIDTVFLVWNAPPSNVANSLGRIVKHAHRVVFLSSPYKTEHPFFQASQPNPVSSLHREIERLIEACRLRMDIHPARYLRRQCDYLVGATDSNRADRALALSERCHSSH